MIITVHFATDRRSLLAVVGPNYNWWAVQYGRFLPRDAMLSAVYAVVVCLSVCMHSVCVCLSHSGIVSQETLLLQRDRARHLSVEILQLQNISLENPIVVHYLCDPTFSHFDTIPECDRHTDTQTHDDGIYRT